MDDRDQKFHRFDNGKHSDGCWCVNSDVAPPPELATPPVQRETQPTPPPVSSERQELLKLAQEIAADRDYNGTDAERLAKYVLDYLAEQAAPSPIPQPSSSASDPTRVASRLHGMGEPESRPQSESKPADAVGRSLADSPTQPATGERKVTIEERWDKAGNYERKVGDGEWEKLPNPHAARPFAEIPYVNHDVIEVIEQATGEAPRPLIVLEEVLRAIENCPHCKLGHGLEGRIKNALGISVGKKG